MLKCIELSYLSRNIEKKVMSSRRYKITDTKVKQKSNVTTESQIAAS